MSQDRSRARKPNSPLPNIGEGVLKRFHTRPPDFEYLYQQLKDTNPRAAQWLLDVTESLAPADVQKKYHYAVVALHLYGMLAEQADVDSLSQIFSLLPKSIKGMTPTVAPLSDPLNPPDQPAL